MDLEKKQIDFGHFMAVDIRCGTVTRAYPNAEARKPAYVLHIDFGEEIGELKSSAQICDHYQAESLLNTQVLAVVNFPPRQIARTVSQCLVLGVVEESGAVVLVRPDQVVSNGLRLA